MIVVDVRPLGVEKNEVLKTKDVIAVVVVVVEVLVVVSST